MKKIIFLVISLAACTKAKEPSVEQAQLDSSVQDLSGDVTELSADVSSVDVNSDATEVASDVTAVD
jgi:hypothetical protein